MSDAPERIWVNPEFEKDDTNPLCTWANASTMEIYDDQTKYVREDLFKELEAKLAKAVEALVKVPRAVASTTVCQGPSWPEDRPGVWLAALDACEKSVRELVDPTIAELTGDDHE